MSMPGKSCQCLVCLVSARCVMSVSGVYSQCLVCIVSVWCELSVPVCLDEALHRVPVSSYPDDENR